MKNYFENAAFYCENQKNEESAVLALFDSAADYLESVISKMYESQQKTILNLYLESEGRDIVKDMDEIDDETGRIYPSEFYNYFDNSFDFDDEYFVGNQYDGFESGSDIYDLSGVDLRDDVVWGLLNGEFETDEINADILEEFESVKADILENFERLQEEEKRDKAMRKLETMVAFLSENADSETLQTIVAILWNINE